MTGLALPVATVAAVPPPTTSSAAAMPPTALAEMTLETFDKIDNEVPPWRKAAWYTDWLGRAFGPAWDATRRSSSCSSQFANPFPLSIWLLIREDAALLICTHSDSRHLPQAGLESGPGRGET